MCANIFGFIYQGLLNRRIRYFQKGLLAGWHLQLIRLPVQQIEEEKKANFSGIPANSLAHSVGSEANTDKADGSQLLVSSSLESKVPHIQKFISHSTVRVA